MAKLPINKIQASIAASIVSGAGIFYSGYTLINAGQSIPALIGVASATTGVAIFSSMKKYGK